MWFSGTESILNPCEFPSLLVTNVFISKGGNHDSRARCYHSKLRIRNPHVSLGDSWRKSFLWGFDNSRLYVLPPASQRKQWNGSWKILTAAKKHTKLLSWHVAAACTLAANANLDGSVCACVFCPSDNCVRNCDRYSWKCFSAAH